MKNGTTRWPDLSGRVFERLTVKAREGTRGGKRAWRCQCACGASVVVRTDHLTLGRVKSCGCFSSDVTAARNMSHGLSHLPEYDTWLHVIARCTNEKSASWSKYGAQGITMCARWRESFEAFFEDMGRKPSPQHSIDRIDNARGYEPANCRWATITEQNRNRRCVKRTDATVAEMRRLRAAGESVRQIAERYRCDPGTVYSALR